MTLVAEHTDAAGEPRILGAGRLSKLHGLDEGRFSVLISDQAQGLGLGKELLRRIIDVARAERLRRLEAVMSADNEAMQHLCQSLGFRLSPAEQGMLKAEMEFEQ
jgi:acetyltransferase